MSYVSFELPSEKSTIVCMQKKTPKISACYHIKTLGSRITFDIIKRKSEKFFELLIVYMKLITHAFVWCVQWHTLNEIRVSYQIMFYIEHELGQGRSL